MVAGDKEEKTKKIKKQKKKNLNHLIEIPDDRRNIGITRCEAPRTHWRQSKR